MKKAFILGVIIAAIPALAHAADERARRDINGNPSLIAVDETTGDIRKVKSDSDGNLLMVSTGTPALPLGAATETKQDTGNTSLSSIDGKIPASPSTAGNQTTANTSLSTIAGDTTSIDTKTPALGAAVTAVSVPVNIASDQTVPVSAASLPLPAGAATSANQTTGNTSLSTIAGDTTSLDGKIPSQGAATTANSTPVNIASDQTVPISAASLPLPSGAATSANQSTANSSLSTIAGDTTSIDGKTPSLGSATSANSVPVVIASDQSDISIDDGGNSLTVDAVQLDIDDLTFASDKVDASGSTLGANSGTDIGDVTINNASGASAVNVQDGGNSLTIDGTVTANAGTGIFDTTGSSISVANVEGTSLSVDDNGGTLSVDDGAGSLTVDATQLDVDDLTFAADKVDASGSTLGSNDGVDIGDVTINNASGGSAVNVQDGGNVLSIDDAGGSLTVDATQLDVDDLTFAADKVDASGSTLGANSGIDIGDVTINNASGASAVNVQDGGNSLTVDATQLDIDDLTFAADKVDASGSTLGANSGVDIGDVTINNAGAGAAVNIQDGGNVISIDDGGSTISIDDGGGIITVDGTITQDLTGNDTPTVSSAAVSGSAVQILFSNSTREGSNICNEGSAPVRLGPSTVTTAIGQRIQPDECFSPDSAKPFKGDLYAISTSGTNKVTAWETN